MLSFAAPSLLLLAPAAAAFVLLGAWRPRLELPAWRRRLALLVRLASVLLLGLALARPGISRAGVLPRLTVFLLDVSASVPREAVARALPELAALWNREVADGQRCALLRFAGRTELLVTPTTSPLTPDLDRWLAADLDPSSTDLDGALRLARTLFREDAANRLVLLTDGRPTRPAADFPPDTLGVPLVPRDAPDVAVLGLEAPLAARAGEPFDLRVTLHLKRPGDVLLTLTMDDLPLPQASRRVRLDAGRHTVVLPNLQQDKPFPAGLHRLLVAAESAGDVEPRNNIGAVALTITGKPQILLVEGAPLEGDFIAALLQAQDFDLVRKTPAELAGGQVGEFVAVILAGVPRDAIAPATVAALKAHVEQSGGGLWVVGSAALNGPRGLAGSPLEALLPVRFLDTPVGPGPKPDVPPPPAPPPPAPPPPDPNSGQTQRVLAPTAALLLVVDKSGSMAGQNIEIVKEACIAAAKALSKRDLIGVLAFDQRPRWVLEFTEADRKDYVEERVLRLLADGGTHIQPALIEAFRAFEMDGRARRCALKHVVLLSDGDTPAADFETVVRAMAAEGITVSTVCVAAARFDATLMGQIAAWGNGRFKFTNSFKNVPELIVNETRRLVSLIPKEGAPKEPPQGVGTRPADPAPPPTAPRAEPPKERPAELQPVAAKDDHEILSGFGGRPFPGLRGRLDAIPRPQALVPLATAGQKPVLVLGRAGLGRTAVWTSDFAGPWSADWRSWPEAGKLVAQLLRHLSGAGPEVDLAARARLIQGDGGVLLRIEPEGPGGALRASEAAGGRALAFEAGARGTLSCKVMPEKPGEPLRLLLQRADGKSLLIGAVRAYEAEFLPGRDLFEERVPGLSWQDLGPRLREAPRRVPRRSELGLWLLAAAALLLPLDVALRRLSVQP